MPMDAAAERPRVLVTGFSVFPGAPVNPTEQLIPLIEAERHRFNSLCDLVTDVFPVDYQGLPARLEIACRSGSPDIAIHFGLSARAQGFTLERLARNAFGVGRPDNAGFSPAVGWISEGGEDLPSTLPFTRLFEALSAAGLPAALSDDAGDYLCNYLFYLSRSRQCPGFAPELAGFIHVPPLRTGAVSDAANAISLEELLRGARIVIETCCRAFAESR